MPKPNPDAELALHMFGQRLRQGFAKKHPVQQNSLETVKDAVRKQYEQEQKAEREKRPVPEDEKARERTADGLDQDR